MPTTARDIIDGAYSLVGVSAHETALEAHQIQDGLSLLNDLLSSWQGSFTGLGAAPVASETDNVRVPRWAVLNTKLQLAHLIALINQIELPATLVSQIKITNNNFVRKLTSNIVPDYPSILPVGSGNYDNTRLIGEDFFGPHDERNF